MEAETDARSPQPTHHLGDWSFSVIIMYEPVLFGSQISTSELSGPAVLRRTPFVLLLVVASGFVVGCFCSPAVSCCVPWPLGRRFAFYRFIVSSSNYRFRYRYRITEIVAARYYRSVLERGYGNFRYAIPH